LADRPVGRYQLSDLPKPDAQQVFSAQHPPIRVVRDFKCGVATLAQKAFGGGPTEVEDVA
jgi:hypothetical protein